MSARKLAPGIPVAPMSTATAAAIALLAAIATGGCAFPHLVAAIAKRLEVVIAIDRAPDRTACGAALLAHDALEEARTR